MTPLLVTCGLLILLPVSSAQECNPAFATKCGADCHCLDSVNCGTGTCVGQCQALWTGFTCQTVCDSNQPTSCGLNCHCFFSIYCGTTSCLNSCSSGWTWVDCQTRAVPCTVGRYGSNCDLTCNCPNRQTLACDRATGVCTAPCITGYSGTNCQTAVPCTVGRYGSNCGQTCNCPNRQTLACDRATGVCTAPCITGYSGTSCQTAVPCTVGRYGSNCGQTCNCPNRQTLACDRATGVCTAPCITGYSGTSCQAALQCTVGRHGSNCLLTCNCPNRQTPACDRNTGVCTALCITGHTGPNCQTVTTSPLMICPEGKYGPGCQLDCGCQNRPNICERWNGSCTDPCYPEYTGTDCLTAVITTQLRPTTAAATTTAALPNVCPSGKYGLNCDEDCVCVNRPNICDRTSGECTGPCDAGTTGEGCETNSTASQSAVQAANSRNSPSLIAGVAVGCGLIVLAVISIVIFVIRRRQRAMTSAHAHNQRMVSVTSGDQAVYINQPANLPEAPSAVYENQPVSVRSDGSTVMNLYDHLDGETSASVYTAVGNPQNINLYDHLDGQTSTSDYMTVGKPQNTDDSDGYFLPVVRDNQT